jgi:hypothetical protein
MECITKKAKKDTGFIKNFCNCMLHDKIRISKSAPKCLFNRIFLNIQEWNRCQSLANVNELFIQRNGNAMNTHMRLLITVTTYE